MYAPLPPVGVTVAEPLLSPLHFTSETFSTEQDKSCGSLIVAEVLPWQLFLSVTITEYAPGDKFIRSSGLFVPDRSDQSYAKGETPPVTVISIVPLSEFLQVASVAIFVTVKPADTVKTMSS